MAISRRNFLKTAGIAAAGTIITASASPIIKNFPSVISKSGSKMKLTFKPYTLELKHVFTLASSSRKTTPVMLTQIEFEGVTGYGEASMPPYLGESHETAAAFLSKVDLSGFNDPFVMDDILAYVESVDKGNYAAKASVDIALHDLVGKLIGKPWYKVWGYNPSKTGYTSFTIGIDTAEVIKQKVAEAKEYKILKVKLGRENDREMIETIRSVTDVPMCVDVNQGWKTKESALEEIHWLKEKGIVFIEQPMDKSDYDSHAWLTERSPLPIIADEALQGVKDVVKCRGAYSGINIKLMKCGGLRAAHKMIQLARAFDMKVMMGCMTETSCAISAASQLAPAIDWADLDGNLLISNDIYSGTAIVDGKITLNDLPGIGIKPL